MSNISPDNQKHLKSMYPKAASSGRAAHGDDCLALMLLLLLEAMWLLTIS